MKKKNILLGVLLVFVISMVAVIITFNKSSYAAPATSASRTSDTVYADFSTISTIPTKYSNSVLYLTSASEIKVLEKPTTTETEVTGDSSRKIGNIDLGPKYVLKNESDKLTILITKSAVDKDGNMLDALIKLTNVNLWGNDEFDPVPYMGSASDNQVMFSIHANYWFLDSHDVGKWHINRDGKIDVKQEPSGYNPAIKIGEPLRFELEARAADVDFSITYYKTGTYNNGQGTKATGVTAINTLINDLDIAATRYTNENYTSHTSDYSRASSKFLGGSEGIVPLTGSSKIYYNKDNKKVVENNNVITLSTINDSSDRYVKLGEADGGIYVSKNRSTSDEYIYLQTDGIWYESTALMLTDTTDSSLTFKYGGISCGIFYSFLSPYPYSIPEPTKKINNPKNAYYTGDAYVYTVSQYVPNRYFAGQIGFPGVDSDTTYKKFVIKDELKEYLSIDTSKSITITNETGTNVTSWFTINSSGNTVTATATASTLANSTFYAHTYNLNIPVKINKTGVNVKQIPNVAKVTTQVKTGDDDEKETNEVIVDIYYKLNVIHLDVDTNQRVSNDTSQDRTDLQTDSTYTTHDITSSLANYVLVEDKKPSNANGTIVDHDVTVTYYYKKITPAAILQKQDSLTNKHVVGAVLEIYDPDNKPVATWTTTDKLEKCNLVEVQDKDGCNVTEKLKPNTKYTVKETKTPDGYATAKDVTFTTDADGNYLNGILIKNEPIRICISTVDANDVTIPGMVVEMAKKDGSVYQKFTSTKEETCYKYVKVDEYTIDEVEVVGDYIKEGIKNITVKDTPETQHFIIRNELKVPKTSLNSGKVISVIAIVFAAFGFGISAYEIIKYRSKKTN